MQHTLLQLPNTNSAFNSIQVAQDLMEPCVDKTPNIMTLDMKDLYANIPTNEALHVTKTLLKYKSDEHNALQFIVYTIMR